MQLSARRLLLALCLALPGVSMAQLMKQGPINILGAPPPAPMNAAPEAPWDPSPAPFLLANDVLAVDQDRRIVRDLHVQGRAAFNIDAGHVLRIDGTVSSPPPSRGNLIKLGAGTLHLSGANPLRGNASLLQGTLALGHDRALGDSTNSLDINTGTRLEMADGIVIDNPFNIQAADLAARLPAHWWAPVQPTADPMALQWVVPDGLATHRGDLFGNVTLVKMGAGTLRLSGLGGPYTGDLLLRQGGLHIDGSYGGLVRSDPGTRLSGDGEIGALLVAGHLAPGAMAVPGRLGVLRDATLAPSATTHIRIDAQGQADSLWVRGRFHADGALRVHAQPGNWDESSRWTIVQADGGVDDGRYAAATSNLAYYTPVLDYAPDRIVLAMQRNAVPLQACATSAAGAASGRIIQAGMPSLAQRMLRDDCPTADTRLSAWAHTGIASWRSAMLEDSRHLREAALAYAGSGRAWARQWFANAQRSARSGDHGPIQADDRDVAGLAVGIDRHLAPLWSLNLFAGIQHVDYGSIESPQAPGHFATRSSSVHLGVGLSYRPTSTQRLSAGLAHGRHRSPGRRHTADGDGALRATQNARSTQAWIEWRRLAPDSPQWRLTPLARLAWVRLDSNDATEHGGPAALHLHGGTEQRGFAHAALVAQGGIPTPLGLARVRASLGWDTVIGPLNTTSRHSFRDDPQARLMESEGQPLARHALRLGLGVDVPLARGVRLGLGYSGQYRHGGLQHGVLLEISLAL